MIHRSTNTLISLFAVLFAATLFIAAHSVSSYAYGDWNDLQQQINNAEDGVAATIVLNEDYGAEDPDEYTIKRGNEITVGRNKIITIDLNGHTIDRNLFGQEIFKDIDTDVEGVFHVEGTLTIIDSSKDQGVIKGGMPWINDQDNDTFYAYGGAFTVDGGVLNIKGGTIKDCSAAAGAVWLKNEAVFSMDGGTIEKTEGSSATVVVSGGSTFNMSGGRIRENKNDSVKASGYDPGNAAVYVENGYFNMSGGSIEDNSGEMTVSITYDKKEPASAVRIGENGSFSISGAPLIDNNGRRDGDTLAEERNVYLASGQKISIADALTSDANIGVTTADKPDEENPCVFTSSLPGKGSFESFVSDNRAYKVGLNSDEEAMLEKSIRVDSVTVEPGELTLETDEEETLNAVIMPENATYKDVLWTSADTGIAVVDRTTGKVTAVSPGNTKIKASADNGKEAECMVTVKPHEHVMQELEAKEATCTEAGNIECWTCSKCSKFFRDEQGENEISETEVITQAEGHMPEKLEYKEASCTEDGNIECWKCGKCGRYFTDEGAATEIEANQVVIKAPGHDWSEWEERIPATESRTGLEVRSCRRCETAEGRTIPKIEPSISPSPAAAPAASEVFDPALPSVKNLKPAKGRASLKAKWKKLSKKNKKKVQGIEIQYSTDRSFADGHTRTVSAKKKAKTKKIKGLARKTTYYTRVRAYKYAGGVKHVSGWSKVKKVRTK